tara:strand:+ start:32 stop:379 length:348 start_codon:yes stop_codon:yes gene_type:complete
MEEEYKIAYITKDSTGKVIDNEPGEIILKFNKLDYNKFIEATTKMTEIKKFFNCDHLKILPMEGKNEGMVMFSLFKNKNDKKPSFMYLWDKEQSTVKTPKFYDWFQQLRMRGDQL